MISRTKIIINKSLYQIGIMGFLGVLIWVAYSIYQAVIIIPKIDVSREVMAPINNRFRQDILDKIATREQLAELANNEVLDLATGSANSMPISR